MSERCPHDATRSSAARLGPAPSAARPPPSYTNTHPLSHHCTVTGWSSRHHEKLGVSFTSLKPNPGCGQTLQCQISAPNTSHQIKKREEEHQAQLAVLVGLHRGHGHRRCQGPQQPCCVHAHRLPSAQGCWAPAAQSWQRDREGRSLHPPRPSTDASSKKAGQCPRE